MSKAADISEAASELEHLMADLPGFGAAGLRFRRRFCRRAPDRSDHAGVPRTRRPAVVARRAGDDPESWTIDVRVISDGVRFERGLYLFPSFPGQEGLGVEFLGPGEDNVFGSGVPDLYDGQRMRPEKLEVWQALRERYGNRDESRVDRGTLLAPAA